MIEHLVSGSRYESNIKVWNDDNVERVISVNVVAAIWRLNDEVLDESSKKQIKLLLSQQLTNT